MSCNVASKWLISLIIAFAIAGLSPFDARAQAPGQNWTQSGMLSCKLNPSIGFVIFGHQSRSADLIHPGLALRRYTRAQSIRSASILE